MLLAHDLDIKKKWRDMQIIVYGLLTDVDLPITGLLLKSQMTVKTVGIRRDSRSRAPHIIPRNAPGVNLAGDQQQAMAVVCGVLLLPVALLNSRSTPYRRIIAPRRS